MAEEPWCCSYDRRGEMCPACLRANARLNWRELHQIEQPRLSDGYTAIQFIRPGLYMVKGGGPPKHPVPSGEYHDGMTDHYLTEGELATRWRISPRTLERWRRAKVGPAWRVLYHVEDVRDYERTHLQVPQGEARKEDK